MACLTHTHTLTHIPERERERERERQRETEMKRDRNWQIDKAERKTETITLQHKIIHQLSCKIERRKKTTN